LSQPHPKELRFRRTERLLHIVFDNQEAIDIPFELLRVKSPSAETQGHGGAKPAPLTNKREIDVLGAEPVGHYAVRIRFSDGHDSGLFTWAQLRELGQNPAEQLAAHHKSAV